MGSKAVFDEGQGSWYRRQGVLVVGWAVISGMEVMVGESKEAVVTDQVREVSLERGRVEGGRLRRRRRERVKRVKPVFWGEGVTDVKNWNLNAPRGG